MKTVLFDLDGVLINTEPQYDVFWRTTAEKYRLGIDRFELLIKGTTLPLILSRYFSHLPVDEQKAVEAASRAFDLQLEMIPIRGALPFLSALKATGAKMGLVTSSDDAKLTAVFRALPIRGFFDTVVSADRITSGKPDPMCYLLAAHDLGVEPAQCVVFEDSAAGLTAALNAGMKVIGLTTTLPAEQLQSYTTDLIPDFADRQRVFALLHLPEQ
jgi:HAD superfamily hydrolase (TIGR01509 family)